MAEKVKIKTATARDWQGKTFYNIELEDGRTGSSRDKKVLEDIGKEVELEIKPAKEYNGKQQYYFDYPKEGKKGGFAGAGKNWKNEFRMEALKCATTSIAGFREAPTSDEILKLAEKYELWLNR